MYKINHNKKYKTIEIKDSNHKLFAKIHLNLGASLQELSLGGHEIIKNLAPLTYNNTYASSILFPFANRIKDGKYEYNQECFELETNQTDEHNAIHGLVYNKTFEIVETKIEESIVVIVLEYVEKNKTKGFPFTFSNKIEYTFTKDSLSLKFSVKNTNSKPFPFTVGWHPYFFSENLYQSILKFESCKKLIIDERNITAGVKDIKPFETFEVKDQKLDDCWILNSNSFEFLTPKYQLVINSSEKNNFLQLYTPPKLNTLAIEPTTGVSDSFNNKIGLKTLKPEEIYTITWNVTLKNI